jgi:acyl-CoA thioester hydrolase
LCLRDERAKSVPNSTNAPHDHRFSALPVTGNNPGNTHFGCDNILYGMEIAYNVTKKINEAWHEVRLLMSMDLSGRGLERLEWDNESLKGAYAMIDNQNEQVGPMVEVPIVVRFGDTDPYGVVYFASYFRYCHHGMEEFLREFGLPPHELFRNQEEGFGLPVVGASCDFYRPVKYGEQLRLTVSILNVKEKAVTFNFRFHRKEGNELVAKGQATIVAIDKTWKSRSLPDRLSSALTTSASSIKKN